MHIFLLLNSNISEYVPNSMKNLTDVCSTKQLKSNIYLILILFYE